MIYIISHNRPQNVQRMQELVGMDTTWCVGFEERPEYERLGANHVIETGNLVDSRNQAIKIAHSKQQDCIMIEDDLEKIQLARTKNNKDNVDISVKDAIDLMYRASAELRFAYLIGVAPTANAFYFDPLKPYSLVHFIVGSLIIVRYGAELYFDKQFKLKEDYDYTLQHIQKFGCVLRCNQILAYFKHYGNKGGAVDYRSDDLEQDMIQALKQKWGPNIKLNPRRKNEILLAISRKGLNQRS
jgi:TET-Associated Glycosyltransferase